MQSDRRIKTQQRLEEKLRILHSPFHAPTPTLYQSAMPLARTHAHKNPMHPAAASPPERHPQSPRCGTPAAENISTIRRTSSGCRNSCTRRTSSSVHQPSESALEYRRLAIVCICRRSCCFTHISQSTTKAVAISWRRCNVNERKEDLTHHPSLPPRGRYAWKVYEA